MSLCIAVVADVHVHNFKVFGGQSVAGINSRCDRVLGALEAAVDLANAEDCDLFVIAGDLFDVDTPSPQVLARTKNTLAKFRHDVVLLVGNHDQSSTLRGDHALGVLCSEKIFVFDAPTQVESVLYLPFRPDPVIEWLEDEIKKRHQDKHHPKLRQVFAHFGVADDSTDSFLLDSPDSVHISVLERIMSTYDIDTVVVGNWHNHRVWKSGYRKVIQVGALVPTGFDNPGSDYGKVVIVDGKDHEVREVSGPRFISLTWDDDMIDDIEDSISEAGDVVYLQLVVEPGEASQASAWVKGYAERSNRVVGVRITTNRKSIEAQARKAAKATNKTETLREAVSTYIKSRKDLWEKLGAVGREDEITRKAIWYLEGGS